MKPSQTTVCYRCPECGGMVISPVGAFALDGDMFRLRCPCSRSAVTVRLDDSSARVSVPCVTCGSDHNYTISRGIFFGRKLFTAFCPISGAETLLVGERDSVTKAYDEATRHLAEMIGVDPGSVDFSGDASRTAFHPEQSDEPDESELNVWEDPDAPAMRRELENAGFETAVRTSLAILAEDGRIKCLCSKPENQDLIYDFTDTGICLECASCGAKKDIILTGEAAAERLAEEDQITLDE